MPFAVSDLAGYFCGDWHLKRRLKPNTKTTGTAHGHARFSPAEGGLAYHEDVRLEIAGYRGNASRDYFYRLIELGVADVFFDDGRLFHRLDLHEGCLRIEHRCATDTYRGVFRVLNASHWAVRWQISGPRKTSRIITLYERRFSASQ